MSMALVSELLLSSWNLSTPEDFADIARNSFRSSSSTADPPRFPLNVLGSATSKLSSGLILSALVFLSLRFHGMSFFTTRNGVFGRTFTFSISTGWSTVTASVTSSSSPNRSALLDFSEIARSSERSSSSIAAPP